MTVSCPAARELGARAGVLRCIQILAESAPQEDFGLTVAFLGDAIADPGGRARSVQLSSRRRPLTISMYVCIGIDDSSSQPCRADTVTVHCAPAAFSASAKEDDWYWQGHFEGLLYRIVHPAFT